MRIRLFAFAATLTAFCSLAPSSFGQYPIIPGYRMPNQPALVPAPVVSANGQFAAPIITPGAQPVSSQASPAPVVSAAPIISASPVTSYVSPAAARISSPSCEVGCVDCIPVGCDGRCGGICSSCCDPNIRCWQFFGEFLYLRPRDSEVAWAAPIDGPIVPGPINNNPIQIAPFGVADMEYQAGWRGGVMYHSSDCTAVGVRYTMFESSTNNTVEVTVPNVVRSLVSHPGTQTAAQDFLTGEASYTIDYDLLDIDFRRIISSDCDYEIGYLTGIGLAQMQQTFSARFAGTGTEEVQTDIDFYGVGGRMGIFGEVQVSCNWRIYGKGNGSMIAGEFRADYDQGQSYDPQVVSTNWEAGRIIGIWDMETGVQRTSRCGNYSASFGYVFSAWTNTLQTDEWIQGVRSNSLIGMDSTMTFDGLVARFDARY